MRRDLLCYTENAHDFRWVDVKLLESCLTGGWDVNHAQTPSLRATDLPQIPLTLLSLTNLFAKNGGDGI
ncbi:hypothetical protein DV706_12975 [Natronorubrum bangense]|uniref:Uncharacterized protein n=2 Tax=Natronorubrum bangense TaxID=61858 RepID=L9WRY4_9EURY|nr:hypothetical protein C494_01487 [Natronorubrum bangense JCM 10635]QCC55298.1 hypothetical protein DV706_12975 [Natronorubrum bangense]